MKPIKSYLIIARPHHYVKNGVIWMPIFFGHKLYDLHAVLRTFWVFIAFCLIASLVYIINDLNEINDDRAHPMKKHRPLSSGALSRSDALRFLIIIFLLNISVLIVIQNIRLTFILITYLLLNAAYTYKLKTIAIIDIVIIAIGFILRVFAGGIASNVKLSHWLVIMVFLLAVFLALAKRRDDLILLYSGHNTRSCLANYNLDFVNMGMITMASVIIVSYILYTVSPETTLLHQTTFLYLTTFWIIVGFLRYLQLTFVENKTGNPTTVVLKDFFMQAVILSWLIHNFMLIYIFIET